VPYQGEIFALAAALTWSVSVILFKASEAVTPKAMNLFKNVVALGLFAVTLLVLYGLDKLPPLDRTQADWIRLIVSGVLGIAVADTLIFMALRRLGASLLAVVDCAYAPTIVLFSVAVLGEPIGVGFAVGGVLVVGGVLLAVAQRPSELSDKDPAQARRDLQVGAVIGVLGIVAMAAGVVIVKPILEKSDLFEVTAVRLLAGVIAQLAWALAFRERETFAVFRERKVWKTLIPGSILGTYVAMIFWLGGFKWAPASVAAVFNQLSSVFTIGLAWLFLKEELSWRRGLGAGLAVCGALVVILAKPVPAVEAAPVAPITSSASVLEGR
jgi:drug/metabolite transporter (DMT)-like permease